MNRHGTWGIPDLLPPPRPYIAPEADLEAERRAWEIRQGAPAGEAIVRALVMVSGQPDPKCPVCCGCGHHLATCARAFLARRHEAAMRAQRERLARFDTVTAEVARQKRAAGLRYCACVVWCAECGEDDSKPEPDLGCPLCGGTGLVR